MCCFAQEKIRFHPAGYIEISGMKSAKKTAERVLTVSLREDDKAVLERIIQRQRTCRIGRPLFFDMEQTQ